MRSFLTTRLKRLEAKLPSAQKEKRVICIGIEDPRMGTGPFSTLSYPLPGTGAVVRAAVHFAALGGSLPLAAPGSGST
jgi:hypothetical protein